MAKLSFSFIQMISFGLIFGAGSAAFAGLADTADSKYVQAQSRIELLKKDAEDLKLQAAKAQTLLIQTSQQMDLAAKEAATRVDLSELEKIMKERHGECLIQSEGNGVFTIEQTLRGETTKIRLRFALTNASKFPTFQRVSDPGTAPLYEYNQQEWQTEASSSVIYKAAIKIYVTQDSTSSEIATVMDSRFTGENLATGGFLGIFQSTPARPSATISCVVP